MELRSAADLHRLRMGEEAQVNAGRSVKACAAAVLFLALASCVMPATSQDGSREQRDRSKHAAGTGTLSGTLQTESFVVELGEHVSFADGFELLASGDVVIRGSLIGVTAAGEGSIGHGASGRIVSDTRIVILGEIRAGNGAAGDLSQIDGGDGGSLELIAPQIVCASGVIKGSCGGDGAPAFPAGGHGGAGGDVTIMADRFEDLDGNPATVVGGAGGAGGDGLTDHQHSGNGGNGGDGGNGGSAIAWGYPDADTGTRANGSNGHDGANGLSKAGAQTGGAGANGNACEDGGSGATGTSATGGQGGKGGDGGHATAPGGFGGNGGGGGIGGSATGGNGRGGGRGGDCCSPPEHSGPGGDGGDGGEGGAAIGGHGGDGGNGGNGFGTGYIGGRGGKGGAGGTATGGGGGPAGPGGMGTPGGRAGVSGGGGAGSGGQPGQGGSGGSPGGENGSDGQVGQGGSGSNGASADDGGGCPFGKKK